MEAATRRVRAFPESDDPLRSGSRREPTRSNSPPAIALDVVVSPRSRYVCLSSDYTAVRGCRRVLVIVPREARTHTYMRAQRPLLYVFYVYYSLSLSLYIYIYISLSILVPLAR